MPRPRKLVFNNTCLFVTTAVEEGLLLPANELMEAIIWSALARAQHLHPVRICHFLVEATHVHMLLVVDNPLDIKGFMERFKTESAHAINRLLGRKKRTVWCAGYDSPVVLTPAKAEDTIVYIYSNPAKDGLENSIEKYPGVSSWSMFRSGRHVRRCRWIRRQSLSTVPFRSTRFREQAAALYANNKSAHDFTIHPDAWMECFDIPDSEKASWNSDIVERVAIEEKRYRKQRSIAGQAVIGAARLRRQRINPNYKRNTDGRRMLCVSEDKKLRRTFIAAVKALIDEARKVLQRWREGDLTVPYPPGLFPPAKPRLVEPLSIEMLG